MEMHPAKQKLSDKAIVELNLIVQKVLKGCCQYLKFAAGLGSMLWPPGN
jgi:hypothetical protein